jgi:adenosylcobinamide-phosphate synthase
VTPFARRSLAVAAGLLLDRACGEPPTAVHPVAAFGRVMGHVERILWADRRDAGARYAALGVALGAGAGALGRSTAGAVALTSAGRELRRVAAGIGDHLTAGDLEAARAALPSLVGRDPSDLDASGIAAAVVESLAENTVDAVVASAFWGVVAGAPGAAAHRAINTMDAMVGHRSVRYERFGWAAARTDDIANLVPARLFALLVAAQVPDRAAEVWRIVRRDARLHPSPNAGIAESAVAAALGRQLGGPLRYGDRVEQRPRLGDGPRPDASDVARARDLVDRVEWILVGLLVAVAAIDHLRARRP